MKPLIGLLVAGLLLALAAGVYAPAWMPRASAHGDHAAHGGHSAQSFEAGEPGDASKPFRTLEIIMRDGAGTMSYAPDRIDAKKGEQIKFVLRNEGQIGHEFLIDSFANNAKHKAEMEKNPEMDHEDQTARA